MNNELLEKLYKYLKNDPQFPGICYFAVQIVGGWLTAHHPEIDFEIIHGEYNNSGLHEWIQYKHPQVIIDPTWMQFENHIGKFFIFKYNDISEWNKYKFIEHINVYSYFTNLAKNMNNFDNYLNNITLNSKTWEQIYMTGFL